MITSNHVLHEDRRCYNLCYYTRELMLYQITLIVIDEDALQWQTINNPATETLQRREGVKVKKVELKTFIWHSLFDSYSI